MLRTRADKAAAFYVGLVWLALAMALGYRYAQQVRTGPQTVPLMITPQQPHALSQNPFYVPPPDTTRGTRR